MAAEVTSDRSGKRENFMMMIEILVVGILRTRNGESSRGDRSWEAGLIKLENAACASAAHLM